ncbi:ABC transporter substrate-binding protein [Bosea sp. RAF48]|uniref:ABC transporter substrate-binding protein n=1 Tax=Bosea sp. RAF48 TaxID=3237480 RepID=UPI003F91A505
MKIDRRRLLAGAAALSLPAYIPSLRAQPATIKIGFPTSLTGPFGAEAQDQVRGAQLAVQQFNQGGGLGGRMAELLARDDKLNPGEAATRTLELIEKDQVQFMAGSLSAAVQLSINNITKERRVIFNSCSQSDAINEARDWSRYTFHEALNPHMTTGPVARHAFKSFGKRAALLTADYAFGHELSRAVRRVAQEAGAEIVTEIRHPLGQADYSTFMPRIQAARPDVLFLLNFGRDQMISAKQVGDFGLKRRTRVVAPVLAFYARVAGGPDAFDGVIGGAPYFWRLEETSQTARAFNAGFRAANANLDPSDYAAVSYSGVRAILEAAKVAGSTDSERVAAALRGLRYDHYKGPQYYRACDHQSVQSVLILESKRGGSSANDVFQIIGSEGPEEAMLRSCSELGHAGN